MRRPERPLPPGARAELAGEAQRGRAFQRRLLVQRGQQGRQALREHGLARARRADQQQAVPARRGDLQRALGGSLALDVPQVEAAAGPGRGGSGLAPGPGQRLGAWFTGRCRG